MSQLPPDVDPRPELSRFYDNDDRLREYADAKTLQHEQQRARGQGGQGGHGGQGGQGGPVRRALAKVFPSLRAAPPDEEGS